MTDTNEVRRQFEAEYRNSLHLERRADGQYTSDYTQAVFTGYQAALQSPAVRELVAESERVASHLERAVEYIEKVYPNAKQLDRGPILSNMRRWSGKLRAALRTLGAGHVE